MMPQQLLSLTNITCDILRLTPSLWACVADVLVVTDSYVVTSLCGVTAFILVMHKSQLSNNLSYSQAKFELLHA